MIESPFFWAFRKRFIWKHCVVQVDSIKALIIWCPANFRNFGFVYLLIRWYFIVRNSYKARWDLMIFSLLVITLEKRYSVWILRNMIIIEMIIENWILHKAYYWLVLCISRYQILRHRFLVIIVFKTSVFHFCIEFEFSFILIFVWIHCYF